VTIHSFVVFRVNSWLLDCTSSKYPKKKKNKRQWWVPRKKKGNLLGKLDQENKHKKVKNMTLKAKTRHECKEL
jgi:hypothetical protein